jgi:TRAP-type C4-dicarboxylate transport system permease small subunit
VRPPFIKAVVMTTHSLKFQKSRDLFDLLSKLCIFLASCALLVLVATFGWLVFGRYILNITPTWVEQLALVLICYIAFLGAAAGIHEGTHLGVTLFRDFTGGWLKWLLLLLGDVVLMVFGAIMLIAGLELFHFGWETMLPM